VVNVVYIIIRLAWLMYPPLQWEYQFKLQKVFSPTLHVTLMPSNFFPFTRAEELETALMEMVKQDNRRELSAKVRH
jgi:hypothetical protein